ncbi:probable transcription factor At2g01370 [Durio zibethinus]|uniref:Probable transcription factor At2g01370 n=1 Tax=Durio zibethinus TaxID=66656 RepID=A0A6P5XVM9_DURZI|nr:probable transcription factor At2g01370 [Durio zibethinus]
MQEKYALLEEVWAANLEAYRIIKGLQISFIVCHVSKVNGRFSSSYFDQYLYYFLIFNESGLRLTMSSPTPSTAPNGRFSRVFSESDETQILRCLIRATKSISPPITTVGTPTINRIVKHLNYKFTPSQINDKLRRLRDKYHKYARNRSLVRTHHDRRMFKLSKRIWGKKTTPKKIEKVEEGVETGKVDGVWNLEKFPYLVAEFSKVLPDNEVWKERMKGFEEEELRKMDQEWVFIKVEEAKLVAKKAELMQHQILEIMGDSGSANGVN